MNPLLALQDYGQSVWLDYMQRHLITSGELQRLIDEDGLRGMTSNPAIFEKAITGSTDYREALRALTGRNLDAMGLYEQLAIRDIQDAADIFRPVYEQTRRGDGYISLEVSPHLAHDTQGTIREARRLWQTVSRPNLMIKVPATPAGLPAIEQLISEGINVNVTLLFSQEVYERVAEAYIAGLERLAAPGGDVGGVASVASFFISRIDTAIDAQVMARLKAAKSAPGAYLAAQPARQCRHRQRQAHVPTLQGDLPGSALGGTGGHGGTATAGAVGQYQHQESEVSRCPVRRGTDRSQHRQHHAASHPGGIPRPWTGARQP